ncbi:hypothetical protein AV530_009365 [Patagioenas fasciata monilis]|uniref:Uncharacterized protein n=1 Tax=Patagioenas fasciata monilis TaxID=372326 RepID=A0A1V4JIN2_PATFA|nr:hypothetical protein AV530_009365 [Patagioenas fasciata monilis]
MHTHSFVRKKVTSGAAVAGGSKETDPAASAPQSKRRIKRGTLHVQQQKIKRERGVKEPAERSGPVPDVPGLLGCAPARNKRKRETLSPAAPWDRPCTERLSTQGPSLRQKNYGKSGV